MYCPFVSSGKASSKLELFKKNNIHIGIISYVDALLDKNMEKEYVLASIMVKKLLILTITAALALSCATKSAAFKEIDHAVKDGDFETAIETMETKQEARRPIYPERNSILFFLDRGILEFYAGNYERSSWFLQEAERQIAEAYTKSLTQGLMTYILNDNAREYPGEDFEDIYLNVFNALNYYNRGDIEGALVEIRKLSVSSGKLDMLARKYQYKDPTSGMSLEEIVARESSGRGEIPQGKPVEFSNSALARYLGALFYLGDRNYDAARIEFEQLQRAFLTQRNIYPHPIPFAVEQARNVPQGMARLNVIGFAGLSPVKEEQRVVHYFPFFRNPALHITVFRLPQLVPRPSEIDRIEVIVEGEDAFYLELLEDMGIVMQETFNARYSNILIKTYIRTLIKYTAADIASSAVNEASGDDSGLVGFLTSLGARVAVDASENADIRMSRFLPNRAYIGGINLTPGTYNVTINFLSRSRVVSQVVHRDVIVGERGLNLIDATSLN